jgi:hypothetical protein
MATSLNILSYKSFIIILVFYSVKYMLLKKAHVTTEAVAHLYRGTVQAYVPLHRSYVCAMASHSPQKTFGCTCTSRVVSSVTIDWSESSQVEESVYHSASVFF